MMKIYRDWKYLFAYLLPLSVFLAIHYGGGLSYAGVIFAFGVLPLGELLLPPSGGNLSPEEEKSQLNKWFFDGLLYLNVPIVYGLLFYFLYQINTNPYSTAELLGMTLSTGILLGACGINVAHELGHRNNSFERFIAKMLLLPSFYLHFIIEHNLGHHKHVSTPLDPATARYGESVYAFFVRSVLGSYKSAWKISNRISSKAGKPVFSFHNKMIRFTIVQIIYLVALYFFFDMNGLLFGLTIAVIGFLLLELVNYIEHYGLLRKQLPSGRYEPVKPIHSWNSEQELGRIVLYELTRHADHHYKSTRKYQILSHYEAAPELPTGYPGSMLLALVPPVWFKVMNSRVKAFQAVAQ